MNGRVGFPGHLDGSDARPLPLHPDELSGDAVSAQELGGALEGARALEAAAAPSARPSTGFADRVMASLTTEPTPGRGGYLLPIRRSGLLGVASSLREAWALVRSGPRPLAVRATALAYVLAAVIVGTSLTGVAAYGAAGAFGLLGPDSSPTPVVPFESPGPIDEPSPTQLPQPTGPPTSEPTAEPSPSSTPTPPAPTATEDDDDETPKPSKTPHETDDDDDDETPEPAETPRPSRTPGPSASEDSD